MKRGTRQFLNIGLPMLLGIVGSSFLLGHMMQSKYRVLDNKTGSLSHSEFQQLRKSQKPFSLEEEYAVCSNHQRQQQAIRC
jgi:hypothetical protein